MRAAVYIDRGKIETRERQAPRLEPGDVLLKVAACGVCGTDIRKVQHHLIRPPVVLGHEVAGEVAALGDGVLKFSVGDRVVVAHHTPCYSCHYCRHGSFSQCRKFKSSNLDPGGFAEYVRIPSEHVGLTAFRIPEGLSYERAIFMEPLACVVRDFKRTTILPGDTVLVVGLGSMGILAGQLARRSSARVVATDIREDRIEIGRRLGFEEVLDARDPALEEKIRSVTEGRGADLAVLTAGTAETYGHAVRYLRDGGTLNLFAGVGPGATMTFEVDELYHREITVFSSYSASPAELHEALEHLRDGSVNVDVLTPRFFDLDGVGEAIRAMQTQTIFKAIIAPYGGRA